MIRDVVDDAQAVKWKDELKDFVKVNDERGVEGIHSLNGYKNSTLTYKLGEPLDDKQFFDL